MENPLVVKKTEGDLIRRERGSSYFEVQREKLGIPSELNNKPLLYLSAHQGYFNASIPGHVEAFHHAVQSQVEMDNTDSIYLDLTEIPEDSLIDNLRKYALKAEYVVDGNTLSSPEGGSVPPGNIINVIFLPPLNGEGNSLNGPSTTYALDSGNFAQILLKIKSHLLEHGYIKQDSTEAIEEQTANKLLEGIKAITDRVN